MTVKMKNSSSQILMIDIPHIIVPWIDIKALTGNVHV